MTALEIVQQIEEDGKFREFGIMGYDGKKISNLAYMIRAFKVMREIAIEVQNRNLYSDYLNKKIGREHLKDSETQIDRSFNLNFEKKDV